MIQLLERKKEYYDMEDGEGIDRDYLEKVYRITGYAVIKLNDSTNRSRLKFGSYGLELARPPVYLEEYE